MQPLENTTGRLPGQSERLRINYVSLLALRDSQGRYAVMFNVGRFCRGANRVYTPIGGGVELKARGKQRLTGVLMPNTPVFFEHERDARFVIEDDPRSEQTAIDWLRSTREKEHGPRREVREELVDEWGLLTDEQVATIKIAKRGRWAQTFRDDTLRRGWEEGPRVTLMVPQVFDARIRDPEVERIMLEAAEKPDLERTRQIIETYRGKPGVNDAILAEAEALVDSGTVPPILYWATEAEIRAGRTATGIRIGRICQSLLE